jgi:hypothetical protein
VMTFTHTLRLALSIPYDASATAPQPGRSHKFLTRPR